MSGRQLGVISALQLRTLGYPPGTFADRAAGRQWVALSDEVLRRAVRHALWSMRLAPTP